jgi:hypothetical protein
MLAIETVAVLGSGESAIGCAILAALSGCAVRFHDPAPDALDQAFEAVRFRVDVAIERGLLTRHDRQRILDGILFTPDLVEAATGADLVFEVEAGALPDMGRLEDLVRATTALAAATLEAAAQLAAGVAQPGRVLALLIDRSSGMTHISAEPTPGTSIHTLAAVRTFAARVNARGRHEA